MDTVRIVTPQGSAKAHGTRVLTPDGAEVPAVTKITIRPLDAQTVITAEIEIAVSLADITAHPLLGLESLREAAELHGYDLVKREPPDSDLDVSVSIGGLDPAALYTGQQIIELTDAILREAKNRGVTFDPC